MGGGEGVTFHTGSVNDVSKTISDDVLPKSSFMTFLMDNNTSGMFSKYVLESLLVVNAALSCL